MIEQLVSQFYSESWDYFAMTQGNQLIRDSLTRAKECVSSHLWAKLVEDWFHDAYIMQLHCINAYSLSIDVRRHNDSVSILFPFVSSFECFGTLLDHSASFPNTDHDRPIAQILDIWIELEDEVTMIILLDNCRYLQIRCNPNQPITCSHN